MARKYFNINFFRSRIAVNLPLRIARLTALNGMLDEDLMVLHFEVQKAMIIG